MVGCLWAMGDKPQSVSGNTDVLTSPALFNRGLKTYFTARDQGYAPYAEPAAADFEKYLTLFPTENNRLDALFYLSKCYELINATDKQAEALASYTSEAPSTDAHYADAIADQGGIYFLKGNKSAAKDSFTEALTLVTGNAAFKAYVYQKSLPVYENERSAPELIKRYSYLIDHERYVQSHGLIVLYSYKLARVYLGQGDKINAKRYFTKVAKDKSVQAKDLAESAQSYLDKL
jgi:tetratricopeptide (TPR) repeat protein